MSRFYLELALLCACGAPADRPDPLDPAGLAPCPPSPTGRWDRALRVGLVAVDVPALAAERALARAQAVWAPAGLVLQADPLSALTGPAAALSGPIPAGGSPDDALRALAAGLVPALDAVGPVDVGLVVLHHVVDPSLDLAGGQQLLGLTLTPGDDLGGHLDQALDRDDPPIILLGWDDLHAAARSVAALTPAHELGHALGLRHGDGPLMATPVPSCRPLPPEAP